MGKVQQEIRKIASMAAAVILLVGVFSGCGEDEVHIDETGKDATQVDVHSCMRLVPDGYNGGGNLLVEWDFSKNPVPLSESQQEAMENAMVTIEPYEYYKNGDWVEVSVGVSYDVLEEQHLALKDEEFRCKAEGFSYEVDPFDGLSLPLVGMDGQAVLLNRELRYDTDSPFYQSLQFEASKNQEISNGDKITVKAILNQDVLDTYKLKPTRTEKEFTVSGLGHAAKTIDELEDLLEPIGEGGRSRLLYDLSDFYVYAAYMPDMEQMKDDEEKQSPFTIRTCDLERQYLGHIETEDPSLYKSVMINVYRLIAEDPVYPHGREVYISMAYEAPPAGAVPTEWVQERVDSQIYYKAYEYGEYITDLSYLTEDTPEKLWEKISPRFDENYVFTQKNYSLLSPEESFRNNPVDMEQIKAPLYAGDQDDCYYVEGIGYIRNGIA